jgi:hypothetical protein
VRLQIEGVVNAVTSTSVTVQRSRITYSTLTITPATTFFESGKAVTAAALVVGEHVDITRLRSALTIAASITIAAPKAVVLTGNVTAVTSTSVTVEGSNNSSTTFTIAPTTTFFEGVKAVTASALIVGERVVVTTSAASPTTATKISIKLATLAGTVTSVSGNVITLTGGEGFTRTIDVSSATTYSEGGSATTLSSVIVGSKISADGIVGADQTALDALVITIAAPKAVVLTGNVTAVTSTSVTVEGSNNSSTTFTIAPTTTFFEGVKAVTASALIVGERVVVTTSAASPTTATKISIKLATLAGTVTSVSGNVITLTGGEGFTRTIDVSSATTYSEGGSATTLSSVIVGSKISADGIVGADQTALDALVITIAAPKAA